MGTARVGVAAVARIGVLAWAGHVALSPCWGATGSLGAQVAAVLGRAAGQSMPGPSTTLFGAARSAKVIVRGTIVSLDRDPATISVREVLRGDCPDTIRVNEIIGDVIRSDHKAWVGREVYLFLPIPQDGAYLVLHQVHLVGDTQAEALEAVERAIEVAAIEDNADFVRAVLEEVHAENARLRSEARLFLQSTLEFWGDPQEFRNEIVALFRSDDTDLRRHALIALRSVQADEIIPDLVRLVQSGQSPEATYAATALARYDTPETTAVLAEMAKHTDSHFRAVAVEALGKSRRQEAVDAVRAGLPDESPTVRGRALEQLCGWFREGRAGEAIPHVLAMLGLPDEREKQRVLEALGATGDPEVVDPVLACIRQPDPTLYTHDAALRALAELYPRVTPEAQAHIRSALGFVEQCANTRSATPGYAAVLLLEKIDTPGSTAILERIATTHPDRNVRERAESSLARRQQ